MAPSIREMGDGMAATVRRELSGDGRPPLIDVMRNVAQRFDGAYCLVLLNAVGEIIIGDRSAQELGGPLLIAQVSGQVAEDGILNFIQLVALVSINLGLINLFPIPMLDGGHLLYYAIEAVRGRPLGERAQEFGFRIGLALVLSLFLFVTWNDLVRLDIVDFVKGLVT